MPNYPQRKRLKNPASEEEITNQEEILEQGEAAGSEDISGEEGILRRKDIAKQDDFAVQEEIYLRKRRKWSIVLIIAGIAVALLIVAAIILIGYLKGGMKIVKLDKDDLGIVQTTTDASAANAGTEGTTDKVPKIVNIALFGVDTRDTSAPLGDQNRSDSILILSVDTENNDAKMISILRDSKVPIEGYDPQKINAAYKYGQATLAIKTLNQNFKLDIEDYVTVDFGSLEQVIDLLGGVDIYLQPEEVWPVNQYSDQIMGYTGYDAVEGWNTLNGAQAVSYSRIRELDSDYYRAGRQQAVLSAVFQKIRTRSAKEYPVLIKNLLNCVETSLSYADLLTLVGSMDMRSAEVNTFTVPDPEFEEDLWGGIDDTGSWVWIYDLDKAADRIHEIIYGTGEEQD